MKSPSRLIIQHNFPKIRIARLFLLTFLIGSLCGSFVCNVAAGLGGPEGKLAVGETGALPLISIDETGDASGDPDKKNHSIPFTPDYSLTISKSGPGTGTVSGPDIECGTNCYSLFPQGTVIELIAAPDKGSSFAGWSGGGCTGMVSCVITMNASTEVTAIFRKVFTISLIASNCGKVKPVDRVSVGLASSEPAKVSMYSVDTGSSQTVRISPDPGCHVSGIWVDGVPVNIADTYTFHDIAADHTIAAAFAPNSRSAADVDGVGGGGSR